MSSPKTLSPTSVLALNVRFTEDAMLVSLSDGREISVPLEWFPRLRKATPEQRNKWRFIARGVGIHWEEVDEDIAVTTLLRV
jgi:hypothetical protein